MLDILARREIVTNVGFRVVWSSINSFLLAPFILSHISRGYRPVWFQKAMWVLTLYIVAARSLASK